MLVAQGITYIHPDKELLFENISFAVQKQDKAGLIGNNGSGKSTLLKILAGIIKPSKGTVNCETKPYYVPQHFGQYDGLTIAGAMQIEDRLNAMKDILNGNVSRKNMALVNEDWNIEEKIHKALARWDLSGFPLDRKMEMLSGGEKTKVFLAGISIHEPDIVLMDEPTNHLDTKSRESLYQMITSCENTLLVVSHDRALLQLLHSIYELDKRGITLYGGNYELYKEQKKIEEKALVQKLEDRERELKKARRTEREALERKQRQDVRGKKKQEKAGVPHVLMKKLKNSAEASSAKLKDTHSKKIGNISEELREAQEKLPDIRKMKMDFEDSSLHTGKMVVTAENINYAFNGRPLWKEGLSFQIRSGERINIRGRNGSGKTTLLKIILGELEPMHGSIVRADIRSVYIDQDYSLIQNDLTVYEQAQEYNENGLEEHEIKIRLNRYLFGKDFWERPCGELSGGEKMRLTLCCLMIGDHAPDLFVLDEPTNNLDIQNSEILADAIRQYTGTLLVVSHDAYFLTEMNVNRIIEAV